MRMRMAPAASIEALHSHDASAETRVVPSEAARGLFADDHGPLRVDPPTAKLFAPPSVPRSIGCAARAWARAGPDASSTTSAPNANAPRRHRRVAWSVTMHCLLGVLERVLVLMGS